MKKALFTTLVFLTIGAASLWSQVQIGSALEGSAYKDFLGDAVAMSSDGQRLAAGAPIHDTNAGQTVGQVSVYEWDGDNWAQLGMPLEGSSEGDIFGSSVALSGNGQVLAVGAVGYDNAMGYENVGRVQVYAWNGSEWEVRGTPIEGDMINGILGTAVALSESGEVLAVGAPWYDANFQTLSGRVWIYRWDGSEWQLDAMLDGMDGGEQFGFVLDFSGSGDVLAVGAPQSDLNGSLSGAVRVYAYDGSAWQQLGTDLYGEPATFFGTSVSLSEDGSILAAGKPGSSSALEAGQVEVYQWSGTTWESVGEPLTGSMAADRFGASVALSADGHALLVGSPNYMNKQGRAQYFLWDGNTWTQNGQDITGVSGNVRCGKAVALSGPGDWGVVGSPRETNNNGFQAGNVRVYEFCPPTTSDISLTACQSYTVPSGDTTYTESGIYVDEIPNAAGCGDSIITISLTVLHVDVSLTNADGTLTVGEQNAVSYQWVDCDNNYVPIANATAQSFSPSAVGNYAVIVHANGCVDTSACEMFVPVSAPYPPEEGDFQIFPNPTVDHLYWRLNGLPREQELSLRVFDAYGRLCLSANEILPAQSSQGVLSTAELSSGLYFLYWQSGSFGGVLRFVVER